MTSELQRYAAEAQSKWGLSFPVFGDPTHKLAHHLIGAGVIPDLVITNKQWVAGRNFEQRNWFTWHPAMKKYRHGCAQPAVAVIRNVGGKPFVAYSMAVKPTISNGHGAAGRPNIPQMWSAVKPQILTNGDPTKVDGQAFRAQSIFDEGYIRLSVGCALLACVLLAAWCAGMVSTADGKQWALVLGGGFAMSWFALLLPAYATNALATKSAGWTSAGAPSKSAGGAAPCKT